LPRHDPFMSTRRRTLTAILAATGALTVGVLPAASAADGDRDRREVIHLFQHDTSQQRLDFGTPGPSVGDQFIFGGDIFDRAGGTKLGRTGGHCVTPSPTEILCYATLTISGAQITYQGLAELGPFFSGEPTDFAVTGGTGPFRTARGTLTGRIQPGGADALITIRLRS
jgi:hypothetical protein